MSPADDPRTPGRLRAAAASAALAALAYLGLSAWGGRAEVAGALARVGWATVGAMLALSAANYGLRFLRWQMVLRALGAPQPWRPSLVIYLAGFALTTTPGKAGEALRTVFLAGRGVRVRDSLAAFLTERLSDLLAIALLLAAGLAHHPRLAPLALAGLVPVGLAWALLGWPRGLVAGRRRGRAAGGLRGLLGRACALLLAARRAHRPGVLAASTTLSLLAWAAEAHAFDALLRALGAPAPWTDAAAIYAAGMLAGALSFLPGGLGGTEATMVALLAPSGLGQAGAVAATLLIRLTTLWFAVLVGAVALAALLRARRAAPAGALRGRAA